MVGNIGRNLMAFMINFVISEFTWKDFLHLHGLTPHDSLSGENEDNFNLSTPFLPLG